MSLYPYDWDTSINVFPVEESDIKDALIHIEDFVDDIDGYHAMGRSKNLPR